MKNLSNKQREVYDYLLNRTQNGPPPSVREICTAVGLSSPSSVQAILDVLEEAGYIKRDPMMKRSIHLSGQAENVIQVPLTGTVRAGDPILAFEDVECYIPYSGHISSDKSLFALRVKGDSMLNAGIFHGDIVIVERTPVASNGEIVVAYIEEDEEATVKYFYKEKGQFRLQPANDAYTPITCKEVIIFGKVIALLRNY